MLFATNKNPHNDARIPVLNFYYEVLDEIRSKLIDEIPLPETPEDNVEDPFDLISQIEIEIGEALIDALLVKINVTQCAITKIGTDILLEVTTDKHRVVRNKEEFLSQKKELESKEPPLARYLKYLKVLMKGIYEIEKTTVQMESFETNWSDYNSIALSLDSIHEYSAEGTREISPLHYFLFTSDAVTELRKKIKRVIRKKELELQEVKIQKLGTVYLIGSHEGRILKIGYTKNLEQRLRQLQNGCAHKLEIIKTKTGDFQTEKEELRKARNFRIQGEWFTWDNSIISNF